MGRCGWVWPFFWLDVGGCGWVWPFFWLDVHFQLHQIFKMMFFSSSFPVFPKHFTCFLKIRERGSRILKTVNNLPYANIHIVILLSFCRNILCVCIYYCINETLSKEKSWFVHYMFYFFSHYIPYSCSNCHNFKTPADIKLSTLFMKWNKLW